MTKIIVHFEYYELIVKVSYGFIVSSCQFVDQKKMKKYCQLFSVIKRIKMSFVSSEIKKLSRVVG